MGAVYHAYDPVVKRDVAIKFLSSVDLEETELVCRLEQEARLAGGLQHPNIVTVYDLGHDQGMPYIVMEYIVGRDLTALMKEKTPLGLEQKVDIILQICRGLSAAHQKGIVHRDIKPGNVRLREDNTVKIMDFGIARLGTSQFTRDGYIIGTLQYMSPEQVLGQAVDPRTDLFSTGVIAYELFTGTNPFAGEGTADIMYRILNVTPSPIHSLHEEFGPGINRALIKALQKNRDLRYPSAEEMARDLEEILLHLRMMKFRIKPIEGTAPASEREANTLPLAASPAVLRPTAGRVGIWQKNRILIAVAVVPLLVLGGLFIARFKSCNGPNLPMLAIHSNPEGAEVWIDGALLGQTPLTLEERRNAVLVFRLAGFEEQQVALSTEAWPQQLNVALVHVSPVRPITPPHEIRIESAPSGAELLMDNEKIGFTPAAVALEDDQPHQVSLSLDCYESVHQTIDRNSPDELLIRMKPDPAGTGYVRCAGQYPMAVFLEGKVIRGNPVALRPGTYNLTFKATQKAYIRFSRKVEVKCGDTVNIGEPAMGSITVKANPSNCRISIDGDYMEDAPVFDLPVQAGSHVVHFDWHTLDKKRSTPVTVLAGRHETLFGVPE